MSTTSERPSTNPAEETVTGTTQSTLPFVGDHPAGIRRALLIVVILAGFLTLPYLGEPWIPELVRLQVLRSTDPIPFSNVFDFRSPQRVALGGVVGNTRGLEDISEADLLASVPLPEATVHSDPSPPAQPPHSDGDSSLRIPPSEFEGLTRQIENPERMIHFFQQLKQVGQHRPDTLARISMYGTSTMGADRVTSVMRHSFQTRFGDGGKGWIPIAPGWQYQSHRDVQWGYHGWTTKVVNRNHMSDGRYGFGGVLAMSRGVHATAHFGTQTEGPTNRTVSRFRLFYEGRPDGGTLGLQVDEGPLRSLSTVGDSVEDRVEDLTVPQAPHDLHLSVQDGNVRLYGMVMENQGPGVVVDGLMLIGAFTRILLNFDAEHIAHQVAQRQPDLIIYWMGANDAVSDSVPFRPEEFRAGYIRTIHRMRADRPETSCLVMSVMDKGESVHGYIRTMDRVPHLVDVQQQVAEQAGCAFFNTYEAIGGNGTMRRWYHNNPHLVSGDFGHLTGPGTRVVGALFYKALIKAYDDFLATGA